MTKKSDDSAPTMIAAVTVWVEAQGYGFLRLPGERRSAFLHFSDLEDGAVNPPNVGDLVEFQLIEAPRGPRAYAARIAKRATPAR